MRDAWKYTGPIFDAHTHIGSVENTSRMIAIEEEYGVTKQVGIVHDEEGFRQAKEQYPGRFVYAKYLSLSDIAQYNVEPIIDEISKLLDDGFAIASQTPLLVVIPLKAHLVQQCVGLFHIKLRVVRPHPVLIAGPDG